jgi:hypothetical protein
VVTEFLQLGQRSWRSEIERGRLRSEIAGDHELESGGGG